MTTKDEIQTSINSRLQTPLTKIEGGTIQDIIGSISYELANIIDTKIETVLDNAFVTTADEEHLEIKGEELGITRRLATYAIVEAQILDAAPNITIPKGIKAKTKTGLIFEAMTDAITDESGCANLQMQCLTSGSIGNIAEYELNSFYEAYENLNGASITNNSPAHNGYDIEDVEQYRQRILEYLKDDAANSNISDYTFWAKSVAGVKHVVVQDASVAGAGHVDVYISSVDNEEVTGELIKNVKNYIQSEQIINAIVSVYPLEYFDIDISADVVLEENADLAEVKEEFKQLLKAYLDDKPDNVSYLYISNLLFETKGILDVSNYLLNNSAASINIQKLYVPVCGEILLTAV